MTNQASRWARDDETRARHEQAVAAGERRMLARTENGELHSYARDEIGFPREGSGPIASSSTQMWILAGVFAVFVALSLLLVAAPTQQGEPPFWGALFLTIGSLTGSLHAAHFARAEARAKRVRRARGVPEPRA